MKIANPTRVLFYISFGFLFLSGATFFFLDHFVRVADEWGEAQHPAQIWSLRCHGIVALWFLFLMGILWVKHIWPSLRIGRRKASGLFLLLPLLFNMLTAPALLYLTDEDMKHWTETLHSYVGLFIIIPFATHIVFRKRN
ncbi:MAG: hypothetical protein C5B49_15300 [Bdellovibrio sp.]|nr:MAG: hypothetical protein C5B49_15300 [Bdellovibrio sp.]